MAIVIKEGEIYTNGNRIVFPRDANFSPAALLVALDENDEVTLVRVASNGGLVTATSATTNTVKGSHDLTTGALAFTSSFGATINKQISLIALHITTAKARNITISMRDTVALIDYVLVSTLATTDTDFFIPITPLKMGLDNEIKIEVSQAGGEDATAHYTIIEEDL